MKNYNPLLINRKKLKKNKISKNEIFYQKHKRKQKKFIYFFISLIILFIIILILKFTKIHLFKFPFINIEKIKYEKQIINNTKVCVCTLAKLENRYIREFVQHYEKYGVDKIFLYDNNDVDGESFEEVINDYIKKGFVKILNWRGKNLAMMKIMNDCYKRNYNNYDWLIFYEIDEYIHLYNYKNVKLFLNQTKFANCEEILLNLVCHTDNNNLYYENKPLKKRFPKIVPNTKFEGQILEVKSIIRGHIKELNIIHNHLGNYNLKTCNNSGIYQKFNSLYTEYPDQKYYYIDHYYSKSTEEFINKIIKGDALRDDKDYIYQRIGRYFNQSEITKEKIDMIEEKTKINLKEYRKQIN